MGGGHPLVAHVVCADPAVSVGSRGGGRRGDSLSCIKRFVGEGGLLPPLGKGEGAPAYPY